MNKQEPQPFTIVLIPSTLLLGATTFLIIVLGGFGNTGNLPKVSEEPDINGFNVLVIAFLIMYAVCLALAYAVPKFTKDRAHQSEIQNFLTKLLIKYALMMGPTFFGLIVLMQGTTQGILKVSDNPYIGLLAYGTLVLVYLNDLPKLIKMKNEFATKINDN